MHDRLRIKLHRMFLLSAMLFSVATHTQAHEFWIEPQDFTPDKGEPLRADIKVGQKLIGSTQAFRPQQFEQFDVIQGNNQAPVKSNTGDYPAVNEENLSEGLVILAYTSTPRSLRYSTITAGKFEAFLKKEGIPWVIERHQQRGLPEKGFTEAYSRFAKSLVNVGAGGGLDQAIGLELELVMLTNPYADANKDLAVQLLWQGKPLPDAQLNVFFKPQQSPDSESARVLYQTDQQGVATILRPDKAGMMLLNAVHMIEPDAQTILKTGAVWESLWASTTFAIEDHSGVPD